MPRFLGALLLILLLLTACTGTNTDAPPDVSQLLTDANNNMHSVSTFRLSLEQSGAPYYISVNLGEGVVDAQVRRASAYFQSPDVMQGSARVLVGALAIDVGLFARVTNQWVSLPGGDWINVDFAPGFDASTLQAQGGGFERAITGLQNPQYVGAEDLEDGTQVYHLSGTSNGDEVAALTVGLIESDNDINVDLYIERETRYPRRVVLTQPETVTEDEPEPTTWTVDIYDFNAPVELDDPEAGVVADATSEATAVETEAMTPEATAAP
ncbi:MAG: LppX_LprAFG lipoprotein [Anaerolineae bacterium]